jgi:hypothetical protein
MAQALRDGQSIPMDGGRSENQGRYRDVPDDYLELLYKRAYMRHNHPQLLNELRGLVGQQGLDTILNKGNRPAVTEAQLPQQLPPATTPAVPLHDRHKSPEQFRNDPTPWKQSPPLDHPQHFPTLPSAMLQLNTPRRGNADIGDEEIDAVLNNSAPLPPAARGLLTPEEQQELDRILREQTRDRSASLNQRMLPISFGAMPLPFLRRNS